MKHATRSTIRAIGLTAGLVVSQSATAEEFRWASSGDAHSLDPYYTVETFSGSLLLNVYEGLVRRNPKLELEPSLATSWEQTDPTTWVFHLREGVRFHDGDTFDAHDVVFSLERAKGTGSAIKAFFSSIVKAEATDPHTVTFTTSRPNPILPQEISAWAIMSKEWAEANGATQATAGGGEGENYTTTHANGTGPYIIESREPDVRTVFVRNPDWWESPTNNADTVVFDIIPNSATRVAALLSGDIDMVYNVPPESIDRLKAAPGLKVLEGPSLRTIYLGFDVDRPELTVSSVKGANPFKDIRVRQAISHVIDAEGIVRTVMRGQAVPIGMMAGPGVQGYFDDLAGRPAYDVEKAKALMVEAGYPDGFEVEMDCTNDRYIKDGDVCQAAAIMMAKIGIKVSLNAQSKTKVFPKIFAPNFDTPFYLLGWAPASYDIHSVYERLLYSRGKDPSKGTYNIGGFSNETLDALIDRIGSETDPATRNELIRQATIIAKEEYALLPLHQEAVVWAMKDAVQIEQYADAYLPFRLVSVE